MSSTKEAKAAMDGLLKNKIQRHQCCEACAKYAYRATDMFMPMNIPGNNINKDENGEEGGGAMDFDEFIYQLNTPLGGNDYDNPDAPRLSESTARRATERCMKRVRRLRRELLLAGILKHPSQKYSGLDITNAKMVAPLIREEIQLGNCIGTGGFSTVYEITSFTPQGEFGDSCDFYAATAREHMFKNVHRPLKLTSDMDERHRKALAGATVTTYALKHLRKGLIKDPERFERAALDLCMEAQLLLCMDHPNIVAMRGWSSQGVRGLLSGRHTSFFILMDRLPETLEDRIFYWKEHFRKYRGRIKLPFQRQKFTLKLDELLGQRFEVAHDIASALEYMHDMRIINRDLKVTNIAFDGDGVVKLFDFGLSRLLPAQTEDVDESYRMSRVGTKYYMAPEVRKKQPYNVKADVYSYGVVAWEVITMCSPREVLKRYRDEDEPAEARVPLVACPCWPMDVQTVLQDCVRIGSQYRPSMKQVRQTLAETIQAMHYTRRVDLKKDRRPSLRMDLSDYHNVVPSGSSGGSLGGSIAMQSLDSKDEVTTLDDHDIVNGTVDGSTIADRTKITAENTEVLSTGVQQLSSVVRKVDS